MQLLYQIEQIRQLESLVFQQELITPYAFMQRAGQAAFHQLQQHWPEARRVVVCLGKGNNAGDGLIVALLAYQQGLEVSLLAVEEGFSPTGAAAEALDACLQAGLQLKPVACDLILDADVVVDALLGIGLTGEVREPYAKMIANINESAVPVLSLDTPSGLSVDTGTVAGCAVHAKMTVTFVGLKQGLFTSQAVAHTGRIVLDTLGIADSVYEQVPPSAELLTWSSMKELLPRRARDAHKGCHGHVLVIGGDYGMGGAVRIAAESALRAGAGLVSVATRPEHVNVVSGARPEIMCHQVTNSEDLLPLLERASVVVIGPGLGKTDWALGLMQCVLSSDLPKVLDADALNLLSMHPCQRDDWILTPHPGEASRLLGCSVLDLQQDRFASARNILAQYGGVLVLKGPGSIVQCRDKLPKICPVGNPGMATAGMGDVLAGVIGGLLSQGLSLSEAARVGTLVHSRAADMAAAKDGERGLLATDLLPYLREMMNPDE